jgi:hypothetical protein
MKEGIIFFVIPLYLQSVLVYSANCVKTYAMACRRVFSSAPLYLINSVGTFANET